MCLMWVIEGETLRTLRKKYTVNYWGFFGFSLGCVAGMVVQERTVSALGMN